MTPSDPTTLRDALLKQAKTGNQAVDAELAHLRQLVGIGDRRLAGEVGADDRRRFAFFYRRQVGNNFGESRREVLRRSGAVAHFEHRFVRSEGCNRGGVKLTRALVVAHHYHLRVTFQQPYRR